MILINGKELDEHGLHARVENRKRCGLYPAWFLELLERETEPGGREVLSVNQAIFDLRKVLDERGSRLEPPPDLAPEDGSVKQGRLLSFLRRLQTRYIRAVCEGYVQQQELFNIHLTTCLDISFRQLYQAEVSLFHGGLEEKRDLWLAPRPEWDGETVRRVTGEGSRWAVVVGIPGMALLQELYEASRLLMALDTCDQTVAEAQSRFLPAWCHPLPASVLERLGAVGVDLMVISFPECFTALELDQFMQWGAENLVSGGRVLVALNRARQTRLYGEDGYVRPWPRDFLEGLMRRRGLVPLEPLEGEPALVRGEKTA